jgi:hypothetical protein
MTYFDYFAGVWVLCLVAVIVYFAIDEFKSWRGTLKKLVLILAIILAWTALAQADLQICGNTTSGACTTCSFQGLPSSIVAANVAVSSGACCVDIQSLIGTSGTYTVTFEQCEPVIGTGIPAGTQSCSAAGASLSFSLPTVVILTAPGAPALTVK